jgi:four helix bundle protein
MQAHRDLKVWQKAMDLVTEIYAATATFPRDEMFGLSPQQLRRAAVSVPSNLAEGHGRSSRKEFHQYVSQARGSLCEVETQLEIARNLKYIERNNADNLLARAGEVAKMLNGLREWARERADYRLPTTQERLYAYRSCIGTHEY